MANRHLADQASSSLRREVLQQKRRRRNRVMDPMLEELLNRVLLLATVECNQQRLRTGQCWVTSIPCRSLEEEKEREVQDDGRCCHAQLSSQYAKSDSIAFSRWEVCPQHSRPHACANRRCGYLSGAPPLHSEPAQTIVLCYVGLRMRGAEIRVSENPLFSRACGRLARVRRVWRARVVHCAMRNQRLRCTYETRKLCMYKAHTVFVC